MICLPLLRLPLFALVCLCLVLLNCLQFCLPLSVERSILIKGQLSTAYNRDKFSHRHLKTKIQRSGRHVVDCSFSVSLPSGKLLLLFNTCLEEESYDGSNLLLNKQVDSSCDVSLLIVDPSNGWKESTLQLLGPAGMPNLRGAGVWGLEKQESLEKILVLFWSGFRPTEQNTCFCTHHNGCPIKYDAGAESLCRTSMYNGKPAPQGARVAQGKKTLLEGSSDLSCKNYILEAENGWKCGSSFAGPSERENKDVHVTSTTKSGGDSWSGAKQHKWGQHRARLALPGRRPGFLFVAEFDGQGNHRWIRKIAEDAVPFYEGRQRGALLGGEVLNFSGVRERQYAIIVHKEEWQGGSKSNPATQHCETLLMNARGELVDGYMPGKTCRNCLYASAFAHPETHSWAFLCVSNKLDEINIFINGRLALRYNLIYSRKVQRLISTGKAAPSPQDTGATLLPARGGKWVLLWRETSWEAPKVKGPFGPSASIKGGLWDEHAGTSGPLRKSVVLMGPLIEEKLREPDATSLSLDFALITVSNYLERKAIAAMVNLSKLQIQEPAVTISAEKQHQRHVQGDVYRPWLLRLSDFRALWMTPVKENALPANSLIRRQTKPYAPFKALVLAAEEERSCSGELAYTSA